MAGRAPSFLLLLLLAASSLPANFAGGGGGGDSEALARDADFIDELPNQPEGTNFRQYSGYAVAEPVVNRRYFYHLVEAEDIRPLSKPLIIYFGAQGNYQLGSALLSSFQQMGPFSVDFDGQTLIPNPFSWNKFANVLFVEGPVGVGFSISTDDQDVYSSQDYYIISELYHFTVQWLKRFPEYRSSDVYVAGQSYIGVIGPGLATYILYKNSVPGTPPIHIKGIIMGNPRMDQDLEFISGFEAMFRMNIVSDEINQGHVALCHVDKPEEFLTCWGPIGDSQPLRSALEEGNVYSKFCPNLHLNAVAANNFQYMVYECGEQAVAGYLNIPFVQTMMHAQGPNWGGPPVWQPFSTYNNHKMVNITSSTPYIKAALTKGVRVLIYSGMLDEEIVIPNLTVIKSMNLTISSQWRPWFDNEVEVAGFTESYVGGLTYVTVRNAGLKAMADQPQRTFIMAKSFVTNTSLPFTNFV